MSHGRAGKTPFPLYLTACTLLGAVLIGLVAGSKAFAEDTAGAQPAGACFDIVRPPTRTAAGAILLDRCTGQSWILVRNRTANAFAYRWWPIARVTNEVAAIPPPAPVAPGAKDKCFTFQGRRFCE